MKYLKFVVMNLNIVEREKIKTYWIGCCEFEYDLTEVERNIFELVIVISQII